MLNLDENYYSIDARCEL